MTVWQWLCRNTGLHGVARWQRATSVHLPVVDDWVHYFPSLTTIKGKLEHIQNWSGVIL